MARQDRLGCDPHRARNGYGLIVPFLAAFGNFLAFSWPFCAILALLSRFWAFLGLISTTETGRKFVALLERRSQDGGNERGRERGNTWIQGRRIRKT